MRELKIEVGATYHIEEYNGEQHEATVIKVQGNLILLEVPAYELEEEEDGTRR